MLKLIIDTLLGGTMERMLKNNNGLTVINTLLLCCIGFLTYQDHQANVARDQKIEHIQSYIFWNQHQNPEAPYKQNDSSKAPMRQDAMLANNKTEAQKEN